jgi:hypothetical protein
MVWATEKSMFDSLQGKKIFLSSVASRPALGPTQPPAEKIPVTVFPVGKVAGM